MSNSQLDHAKKYRHDMLKLLYRESADCYQAELPQCFSLDGKSIKSMSEEIFIEQLDSLLEELINLRAYHGATNMLMICYEHSIDPYKLCLYSKWKAIKDK